MKLRGLPLLLAINNIIALIGENAIVLLLILRFKNSDFYTAGVKFIQQCLLTACG